MSNSKIPHLLQGKTQFIAGKNSVYRREKLSLWSLKALLYVRLRTP